MRRLDIITEANHMKSWVDDEQVTFLSLPFKAATAVNFQSETLK